MRTRSRTARAAAAAMPAALTVAAVFAITACGDSSAVPKKAEAAAPESTTTSTVTSTATAEVVRTPAALATAIPENISYAAAESAFTAKRYDEATAKFDAYTRAHPDNAWGQYMLGLSAWRSGDLERAEKAFEGALQRDPEHVKSLVNLSRVLLDLDRPKDALARVSTAVELDRDNAQAHRVLARVFGALGQVDSALASYRDALAIDPEDVWSMNNMGLLLIQSGRYDEALGPLSRAVQLDDGVSVFQNNLGIALERTGHLVRAGDAYRAALAADSTSAKASGNLARVDGRSDLPGVESVDVGTLGDEFAAQVAQWREEREGKKAEGETVPVTPTDSVPVQAPVVPPADSMTTSQISQAV